MNIRFEVFTTKDHSRQLSFTDCWLKPLQRTKLYHADMAVCLDHGLIKDKTGFVKKIVLALTEER